MRGRLAVATLLLLAVGGCRDAAGPSAPGASAPVASPASAPPVTTAASGPPPTATTGPATTAGPTPATTAPEPSPSLSGVEMVKSGGIAGISVTTKVNPDGTWSRTGDGGRGVTRGRLTDAQAAQLQRLIDDPRLTAEAKRATGRPGRCADAFVYFLHVRFLLIRYEACGGKDRPEATMAIVSLLQTATKGQ
jgi:hypothetical protein